MSLKKRFVFCVVLLCQIISGSIAATLHLNTIIVFDINSKNTSKILSTQLFNDSITDRNQTLETTFSITALLFIVKKVMLYILMLENLTVGVAFNGLSQQLKTIQFNPISC